MQFTGNPATTARTPSASEIFAGNRAAGRIALAVKAEAGVSRRGRVHEAGMLRVRFPHAERSGVLDAVIINTAGGMTGGDRCSIDIKVEAGAAATVTTAAAEKIYRSLGPDAEIKVRLDVGCGGLLAWLPQETILFDRVRLRRTIEVALERDARLLLAETLVFGRTAMGETPRAGHFFDRWRVRVDGALLFAETIRLDGAIAEKLAERAIGGGATALASLIAIPGNDETVAAIRARSFVGEVGASAWNGLAVVRLLAGNGAALRRDLIGVSKALGAPLPRLWLN
jgi:urease accessory protein